MRAGRAVPARRSGAGDAGFTLVEVIVSIMLLGIVMTALTGFFVITVSTTNQQASKQVAVQLAGDAGERVRAVRGSAVTSGRDRTSTDSQWANPVPGVAPYLADMQKTWDSAAVYPAGASAPIPTTARNAVVNGVTYAQNWYVGACWQPPAGGDCRATQTTGYVPLLRVVVAVTWSAPHCPGGTCSYVTSSLVNNAAGDPVFNSNQTAAPPTVTNPGNRTSTRSVATTLQLTATGGAAPLTWTSAGLPAGLTLAAATGLVSGTPNTVGTYSVTVTATDSFRLAGTASFTWWIQ